MTSDRQKRLVLIAEIEQAEVDLRQLRSMAERQAGYVGLLRRKLAEIPRADDPQTDYERVQIERSVAARGGFEA